MDNQFTSDFTPTTLSRQAQLRGWLVDHNLSWASLGRRMDISGKAVALLCANEAISPHRWVELRRLGLPEGLLPRPQVIKRGPKPKS